MTSTSSIADSRKPRKDGPFEELAEDILRDLRSVLGVVIGHLPQAGQIQKPADLQRQLGIDSKLAWQIHRLAFSSTPLARGAGIPKVPAVKRFLSAAQEQGVGNTMVTSALAVLDRLDELIAVHAGDFSTFESMLSGLSDTSEQVDLAHRKAAFRALSHLWGVQVKTQLWCSLYNPGAAPEVFDCASIRGLRGIRRLRQGAPLRLAGHRLTDAHDHIAELHALGTGTLSTGELDGPNLLLDFCTKPCPELEHRVQEGYLDTYLRQTPIGNAGVQTLFLGDVTQGVHCQHSAGTPNHLNNNVAITKPTEALVLDTLVHRELFGPLDPTTKVYGSLDRLGESDPDNFNSEDALPVRAQVEHIGQGSAVLGTPHVPRYQEMVDSVCDQLGWNAADFDVYRCIVEYPMLSSVVSVRFPLPQRM